ncbi:MAG: thioesterase family protein [Proteobacteria bacterium]|nr:thioesterase family protein [Pseudomonadota bacterium]
MDLVPLDASTALRLQPDELGGGFTTSPPLLLSNGAHSFPPEKGAPFGGLMAALCVDAARQGLEISSPLRTLTVQFMAGARFDRVDFTPERLRGGRSTVFAGVRAEQQGKPILASLATFGASGHGPSVRPLEGEAPPPLPSAETAMDNPIAPWFTRTVEYRFIGPHGLMGGHDQARVRVWMRVRGGGPLDELKLAFLLDAVFPYFFTVAGPTFSTSVDLRYDLFAELTPATSPEGWAYFDFATADCSDGWAVEDGKAFAPDGQPLAVARQLRKVLAKPR